MPPFSSAAREVPVDVLPPVPPDVSGTGNRPPFAGLKTFYHPGSGVAILAIDFFVFGTELLSGFIATPVMSVLAFLVTFPLVYVIQRRWCGDRNSLALMKALLGAFMAGLPFSIAGTLYGAAILALSGLPHHPLEMIKRIASGRSLTER